MCKSNKIYNNKRSISHANKVNTPSKLISKVTSKIFLFLFFYSLIFLNIPSFAQNIDQDIIQKQQDILERQQRDLQNERERQLLEQQRTNPQGRKLDEEEEIFDLGIKKDGCVQINDIKIEGMKKLSEERILKNVANFKDKCITLEDVIQIVRVLTNDLTKRGYITSRIYVPEQDLNQGFLTLILVEGIISDISLKINEKDKAVYPLLHNKKKKLLNLRDLEQAIDQLNRLQSRNATLDIKPGEKAGESLVIINGKDEDRLRIGFGFENSGSNSTGDIQQKIDLSVDDAFGISDFISLYYSEAVNGSVEKDVYSYGGFISLPFGYWTVNANSNYSIYRSALLSEQNNFSVSGEATLNSLTIDRVLYRDSSSKIGSSISLTTSSTKNFINDILLSVNSPNLSYAGLTLWGQKKIFGGISTANIGYDRGLTILGATSDEFAQAFTPLAQFELFRYSVSFQKNINFMERKWLFSQKIRGQNSVDNLYSAQRISVGGYSTVAGYRDDGISGNNGFVWQSEISTQLIAPSKKGGLSVKSGIRYEGGYVEKSIREAVDGGVLDGIRIWSEVNFKGIKLNVMVAKGLQSEPGIIKNNSEFYLSIGKSFMLM